MNGDAVRLVKKVSLCLPGPPLYTRFPTSFTTMYAGCRVLTVPQSTR